MGVIVALETCVVALNEVGFCSTSSRSEQTGSFRADCKDKQVSICFTTYLGKVEPNFGFVTGILCDSVPTRHRTALRREIDNRDPHGGLTRLSVSSQAI